MKNPIYIEYYSHEQSNCYKIDLPWGKWGKNTMVLCKVSEGYEKAVTLAREVVLKNLNEATQESCLAAKEKGPAWSCLGKEYSPREPSCQGCESKIECRKKFLEE